MSITRKFGDAVVGAVERDVIDEYESSMVHKSSTVLVSAMGMGVYALGAILAWTIPGNHSALSILVLLPLILGLFASDGWLKFHHVRQEARLESRFNIRYLSALLALALVQLAGIGYNIGGGMNTFAWGMLGDGVIGAAAGLLMAGKAMDFWHAEDVRRRDAQLDAEENLA
ncbi:hypothetical protein [Corynebacterium lipophiloflavum]|nr:hypothetical protein [Corynebacterium lipophiloflavum]